MVPPEICRHVDRHSLACTASHMYVELLAPTEHGVRDRDVTRYLFAGTWCPWAGTCWRLAGTRRRVRVRVRMSGLMSCRYRPMNTRCTSFPRGIPLGGLEYFHQLAERASSRRAGMHTPARQEGFLLAGWNKFTSLPM